MAKKQFKTYGRKNINKLDWLLAIAFVVIAVAALWISLGISVRNAGEKASVAFLDLVLGLGFVANTAKFGQAAVVSAYVTVVIYESLLLLVLGTLYLVKKGLKERIPGLVAEFVAALGFSFFICFAYELINGSAKGSVNLFWPISLILFIIALFCIMVVAVYATFNTKVDISLKKKGAEEPAPVEEQQEEEEEEVQEEEPAPAPVEEQQEEPEEEPEEEEEEEDLEDEEEESEEDEEPQEVDPNDPFAGLGKRRKRVPFENKMRRAAPEVRARYKEIVKALNEYEFNDRKSIPGETFSYKRERLIFITFSGTTLKVHFKLDPKEYEDSPIPAKDASDVKKFEDIPLYLKIKSNLAVKRVIILAQRIIEERQIPKK